MAEQQGQLPSVTIHYAQTLDGRIATRTGHSQWISCNASLQMAHRLRAEHQGIMVGVGTVLADNPRLTVRLVPGASPVRIVVDSTLRTPLEANVLTDEAAPTVIATTARAPKERQRAMQQRGANVLVVAQDPAGHVDLPDLLRRLAELDIGSILIEGGAALITSVLHDGLVDRLIVCIAPKLVGAGTEAVGNLDIQRMSDALTFARSSFTTLGEDIIFDGRFERDTVRSD
jgi:riboflavin-specific deaminase-like protein